VWVAYTSTKGVSTEIRGGNDIANREWGMELWLTGPAKKKNHLKTAWGGKAMTGGEGQVLPREKLEERARTGDYSARLQPARVNQSTPGWLT